MVETTPFLHKSIYQQKTDANLGQNRLLGKKIAPVKTEAHPKNLMLDFFGWVFNRIWIKNRTF